MQPVLLIESGWVISMVLDSNAKWLQIGVEVKLDSIESTQIYQLYIGHTDQLQICVFFFDPILQIRIHFW